MAMALEQESYFQVENNIFQMQSCDCFVAEGQEKTKVISSRTSPLSIHFLNQNENLNLFTNLKPIV